MKDIKSLSPDVLINETKDLVREELRIDLEVLEYLREIDARKLFLERGHSSLFSFCTRELGYSEPQAQLRIDAMRALRDNPEIRDSVNAGDLNVSSVAKVQRFLRKERQLGADFTPQDRAELFLQMKGKSSREVDSALVTISPESGGSSERERPIAPNQIELRMIIDDELHAQLDELKALYSHRLQNPNSTAELLKLLASDALKKISSKETDKTLSPITPKVGKQTRYIPAAVRREVWRERKLGCSFVDPKTGQRCSSMRFLQIDHIKTYSNGGTQDPGNLRLLCGGHNRFIWKGWQVR